MGNACILNFTAWLTRGESILGQRSMLPLVASFGVLPPLVGLTAALRLVQKLTKRLAYGHCY